MELIVSIVGQRDYQHQLWTALIVSIFAGKFRGNGNKNRTLIDSLLRLHEADEFITSFQIIVVLCYHIIFNATLTIQIVA